MDIQSPMPPVFLFSRAYCSRWTNRRSSPAPGNKIGRMDTPSSISMSRTRISSLLTQKAETRRCSHGQMPQRLGVEPKTDAGNVRNAGAIRLRPAGISSTRSPDDCYRLRSQTSPRSVSVTLIFIFCLLSLYGGMIFCFFIFRHPTSPKSPIARTTVAWTNASGFAV